MIVPSNRVRILVATKSIDFRKGHDSLATMVKNELRKDPFTGTVFVFRAKKADRLRLLYWDGTGLVMACKRLEEHSFIWPAVKDGLLRLIPCGMPTEAMAAHVLVSKYADHLPSYCQAQIYSRQSVALDRSTLADWVGRAAFELRPVHDALMADLKRSTKLFMDETRAPVLDPGARKTRTVYF